MRASDLLYAVQTASHTMDLEGGQEYRSSVPSEEIDGLVIHLLLQIRESGSQFQTLLEKGKHPYCGLCV